MNNYDLQEIGKKYAVEMDAYVQGHFDELVSRFTDCFSEYCRKISKMQNHGKKGEIAFIHFSVLRSFLLLKKYELRIDAYDENWYLDFAECEGYYSVKEIFSFFDGYAEELERIRINSLGNISLGEIQQRMFEDSKPYLFYVAEIIRVAMRNMSQSEELRNIKKAPCFIVCIGGYMDRFDILYKEDHVSKSSKEVKRLLQSKTRQIFSYEFFEGLDLTKGDYDDLEFQFSSFNGCDLSDCNCKKSRFISTGFKNAVLKNTKLCDTRIFDADFSGATLENTDFTGAKLRHLSFDGARLKSIDFTKALVLMEMDFKNAEMENCILPESR